MLKPTHLAVFLLLSSMSGAAAQSISPIGEFLAPWGDHGTSGWVAMSPDGVIAFTEEPVATQCSNIFATQRISIIRADGTGYQVVVDPQELLTLPGPVNWTGVCALRIAGGGGTLWFAGLHNSAFCSTFPPLHDFLADVGSGTASLFTFNGADVGFVSFTDDGRKMAFKGFDPVDNDWGFYLADVDGSNAVRFLDTTPWFTTPGVLSGDGSKFLFIGTHGPFPLPSDVYLYDFATDSDLKLSPTTLNLITGASCSADGSRVVYHVAGAPIFAVNGDGSDHHILFDATGLGTGGTGTITRDGEWVYFSEGASNTTLRIRWDGTGLMEAAPKIWSIGTWMVHQPVNADGSIFAFYDVPTVPGSPLHLAVSLLSPPALTTYGFGTPGSTLTWNLAGETSGGFILAVSLALSPGGVPSQYGLLDLDPASLSVLASGPIEAPSLLGSVQVKIPPSLNLPLPVPVHFQALVEPRIGGSTFTNTTTVLLQDPSAASLSAPAGGPGRGPFLTSTAAATGPSNGAPPTPTPEELMRRLALQDPSLAWWFEEH